MGVVRSYPRRQRSSETHGHRARALTRHPSGPSDPRFDTPETGCSWFEGARIASAVIDLLKPTALHQRARRSRHTHLTNDALDIGRAARLRMDVVRRDQRPGVSSATVGESRVRIGS
jgi:hypothetical protein